MKRFTLLCAQLLLCFCFATVAIADSADVIYVECPDDFSIQSIDVSEDGTFLLAGATGELPRRIPLMMSVDTRGKALWSLKPKTKAKYESYSYAKYLDDGAILSQHFVGTSTRWVTEWIRDGKVIRKVKPNGDVYGVCAVPNGFLVFSKPEHDAARLTRMDLEGRTLWEIGWNEWLFYEGMITRDGVHVIYASKSVRENEIETVKTTGVMMAIDDQGKQLWRYDSVGREAFLDAVWSDEGNVVVVGTSDIDFIAEYDANVQLWCRDVTYVDEDGHSQIIFDMSIISTQNGYLIAQRVSEVYGKARMLLIDRAGNIVNEWFESHGDVFLAFNISLHQVGDCIYLVANGTTTPEDLPDKGMGVPDTPLLTGLVEIDVPA